MLFNRIRNQKEKKLDFSLIKIIIYKIHKEKYILRMPEF